MRALHYAVLPDFQPPTKKQKKFAPSLTEDINHQSSHWNNGKMKTACNSVHIQTETLNLTFAQQAVIVYCYICSNHRSGYCRNVITLSYAIATICGEEEKTSR